MPGRATVHCYTNAAQYSFQHAFHARQFFDFAEADVLTRRSHLPSIGGLQNEF